jgi:hypothetical protein
LRTEHNGVAESAPSLPPPERITSHPESGKSGVTIDKEASGALKITFAYTPLLAEKVRTLKERKWYPEKKYWSVPYSEGIVEEILKVFEGVEVHLDPALKAVTSVSLSGKDPSLAKSSSGFPTLEKGGKGGFSGKNKTPVPPELQLEDLRRELVTRKYSYKTVKGYLYFNRDFLKFSRKAASEINDGDIKDYLLYLAEEKESATATINQAINALKFYYGAMLKKKFVYEVRRPRKDKKLPTVLSQEEVEGLDIPGKPQTQDPPDARLCLRPKGERGSKTQSGGYRQRQNAAEHQRGEGAEGQMHHAFTYSPGNPQ